MTNSIVVAETLRQRCITKWDLLLDYNNNRFIAEMANDSLPIEKFIFYLKQDHAFLKEFCFFLLRVMDAAVEPLLKTWLESLHQSTVNHEMHMQEQLLISLGSSEEHIEMLIPAEATINYISLLRKVLASKSLEEMISVMAPCPWSYHEIAQEMLPSCSENKMRNRVYQKWVEFYASKESQQQVEYLKGLLGRLYSSADKERKLIMERSFCAACQQEYAFWKMAYNMGPSGFG